MTTMTAEKELLCSMLDSMCPNDVEKVLDYAAYLRYIEEREDAEDAAYIEAHRDDPTVPLEEALRELGL